VNPFQLIAPLKSPMIIGDHSVSFISLMHHILFMHYGSVEIAAKKLDDYLLKTDGVYHASSLVFGITMNNPLIACWSATIRVMRPESDLNPCFFKPNGANEKYKTVQTLGGLSANRVTENKPYMAPYIVFFVNGKQDKITALFNHYIHSIGSCANLGFGSVGEASSKKLSDDHSFYTTDPRTKKKTMLVGRVPKAHSLSIENSGKVRDMSLLPPFYSEQSQVSCYAPERINRVIIS
jgi:hypothetical protein